MVVIPGGVRRADADHGALRAWACDFSAGFGIVAPMLSLWHVGIAVGQIRDRAFASVHPAVPATVLSVDTVDGARGTGSATNVVLVFQPTPSSGSCQVAVRSGVRPAFGQPGASVQVVPRSPNCEAPLILAGVGDPMQTFALAAALMAGAVVALKLWAWLGTSPGRALVRPVHLPWEPMR